MKILLTGVTGYIGKRLLPNLFEAGHKLFVLLEIREGFKKNILTMKSNFSKIRFIGQVQFR